VDLLIAYFRTDEADEDGIDDDFLTENHGTGGGAGDEKDRRAEELRSNLMSVQSLN
jgi:hypothetical protein